MSTTTQEQYARAVQSSSLRMNTDEHSRGDADVLVAAGWSKSRFGSALMRLQSEWDGMERLIPTKPTKRDVAKAAQESIESSVVDVKGKQRLVHTRSHKAEYMEESRKRLESSYAAQMQRTVAPLKTLRSAGLHLSVKMALDGVTDEDLPARLLLYWLNPKCGVCHGTGIQPNSERGCGKCREHPGTATPPGGAQGRKALNYIEDCIEIARTDMRHKLNS